MSKKGNFYIATPIYYVNDRPHLGHAYTTVSADVVARFHRMLGENVLFLTGTDEHGSKVEKKAEEVGKTPKELCDENSGHFQMLFDRLSISNDDFIRTTEDSHKESVKIFMSELYEKDSFYEDRYEGLYCTGCERFITEKELVEGKCPDHKTYPEKITEKNYFFKLKEYLPKVKELIARGELQVEPESRRKEVLGLLDNEVLDDFSVSRESVKWGIPLPFDDSQVIYVWVEALQFYISALGYGRDNEKFEQFWPVDVHVIGKDIIKFHAIYWPAMLLAAGLPLPKKIYAHGYFTINGDKMSKTIGNVIDTNDLIDSFGTDATRYLLLSQFPFGQDGDIKADKFIEQYNADLANGISNLLHRTLSMTEKYFNGITPTMAEEEHLSLLPGGVEALWNNYKNDLNELKVEKALSHVTMLVKVADGYIEQTKPWELAKEDQEKLANVMYTLLEFNRHISFMLYPFMPDTAEKMQTALGVQYEEHTSFDELIKWGTLERGTKIKKDEPLFMRREN